jgi:hypothetical protein
MPLNLFPRLSSVKPAAPENPSTETVHLKFLKNTPRWGPEAEWRTREYFAALKSGQLRTIRAMMVSH